MAQPSDQPDTSTGLTLKRQTEAGNLQRDQIDDMFTPEENYSRNKGWAKPGPYDTDLSPPDEVRFQNWVQQNGVNWTPRDKSYDMRGFWKAMRSGDKRATATPNPNDRDHKTGKPPATIPHYVGGGKFLQPLLYGLAAAQLLDKPVESGRLFYSTQNGGYHYIPIEVNARSRAFLTKLLENIEGAIASGFLPPLPQKDSCAQCDYRVVCGPYEERRAAHCKDRRDDRIDPLTEIRAML